MYVSTIMTHRTFAGLVRRGHATRFIKMEPAARQRHTELPTPYRYIIVAADIASFIVSLLLFPKLWVLMGLGYSNVIIVPVVVATIYTDRLVTRRMILNYAVDNEQFYEELIASGQLRIENTANDAFQRKVDELNRDVERRRSSSQ